MPLAIRLNFYAGGSGLLLRFQLTGLERLMKARGGVLKRL